jgi:t-SNARE complex subunit (syntaxin)
MFVHAPATVDSRKGKVLSQLAETLSNIKTTNVAMNICPVIRVLNELDTEDAAALRSALDSYASTRSIHAALRSAGISIDRQSISLHRDNRCRCLADTRKAS